MSMGHDSTATSKKNAKKEHKKNVARLKVTLNPSIPPEILTQLARDENHYVRIGVALNPSTPPEVLAELARDRSTVVRLSVAQNSSRFDYILLDLIDDNNEGVREAALTTMHSDLD